MTGIRMEGERPAFSYARLALAVFLLALPTSTNPISSGARPARAVSSAGRRRAVSDPVHRLGARTGGWCAGRDTGYPHRGRGERRPRLRRSRPAWNATQLIGGQTIVTLDVRPVVPPATLGRTGPVPDLPVGPTRADILEG